MRRLKERYGDPGYISIQISCKMPSIFSFPSAFLAWLGDLVKGDNWASYFLTSKEWRSMHSTIDKVYKMMHLVYHWTPAPEFGKKY